MPSHYYAYACTCANVQYVIDGGTQVVQVRLGVNVLKSALFASFVAESKLYGILLFHFCRAFILNDLLSNVES